MSGQVFLVTLAGRRRRDHSTVGGRSYSEPMLSPTDCLAAITSHSEAFAAAARGRLEADVRHCPGWTVADLVAHVIDVHWYWATIVEQRITDQPGDTLVRPERAGDDELVATFEAGARRLVRVLDAVDPRTRVWTWAPGHQDAAFVIRHQVQEIAVHHWDVADATGATGPTVTITPFSITPEVAADAIDEFLEVSISSDVDPADAGAPVLAGSFGLRCTDTDTGAAEGTDGPGVWRITDGATPGTMRATTEGVGATEGLPTISGRASDLLLWLYQRIEVDPSTIDLALLQRFRALTYTT